MSKKSLPQFLFLQTKGQYEVPYKKKRNTTKLSGFNENYNLHNLYHYNMILFYYSITQAILVE